jgi:hypothetical protein
MGEFAASRQFVRGAARYHDLIYILSKGKALLARGIAHTSAIAIDQGDWADCEDTDWDSTAIAVAKKPNEKLVFVGEDGDVCVYGYPPELITPAPKVIRYARTIEGLVVACGMMRQVYKRVDEGSWQDMSAPYPSDAETAGFEAIDAYSFKELYAVGWSGEIWQHDGSKWFNRASPTNVILTAVCCAPNGIVYAAGQQGVLLTGRANSWDIVQWEEEVDVDFWDLLWFNDRLYVATIRNLFTLQGNALVDVDFGQLDVSTCFNLTQADGVMWSIGAEDALSFDGNVWRRYD